MPDDVIDYKPFRKIEFCDPESDAVGYLVIDTSVYGASGGGVSVHSSFSIKEVEDLSRTMTLKLCGRYGQDMMIGGAKAGISCDPKAEYRGGVVNRFFKNPTISDFLQGRGWVRSWRDSGYSWVTGPDMYTTVEEIEDGLRAIGVGSMQLGLCKSINRRAGGDSETLQKRIGVLNKGIHMKTEYIGKGGNPVELIDVATPFGVLTSAKEFYKKGGGSLEGKRVLIEGAGTVGMGSALLFEQNGCEIVGMSDAGGFFYPEKGGLDIRKILEMRDERTKEVSGPIRVSRLNGISVTDNPTDLFNGDVEADILIPAAARYTIEKPDQVKRTGAELVVCGANFPFKRETKDSTLGELNKCGIFVISDWVANGGVADIFHYLASKTEMPTADDVFRFIEETTKNLIGISFGTDGFDMPGRAEKYAIEKVKPHLQPHQLKT